MPKYRQTLAKLTQPRLYKVLNRDRLHSQLDILRENYQAIWVSGPPGAGKTTCVSSYLSIRQQPAIWYQLDKGDNDLASFFYHLRIVAQSLTKKNSPCLPILAPEYLSDIAGFSRLFFRRFFSLYSKPTVWVLDNYQEIDLESAFHSIIEVAISELPREHQLIVISHIDPPLVLARVLANNYIGRIKWDDLRLTLEEIAAIVTAAGLNELHEETLIALKNHTDGWVTGLVLLIESIKQKQNINQIQLTDSREIIFNYFTNQVFNRLPPTIRKFLLNTSILPELTVSEATLLSKDEESQKHLDYLYHRRLFINRRNSANRFYYQYHALFREFLLARTKDYLSIDDLKKINEIGASISEENGELIVAANLLSSAQAWEELYKMVNRQATSLINQGRNQTLQEIIAFFPQTGIQHRPWLLYWRGLSYVIFNPLKAKQDFKQAFLEFQQENDILGLFLTCGEIFDVYFFLENDIRPVIRWAEQLQNLLNQHGNPPPEVEVFLTTKLQGLVIAAPHHPLLELFEKRIESILRSDILPSQRLAIASAFVFLSLWRGNHHKTLWIIKETNIVLASNKELPPFLRILWLHVESAYAWSTAINLKVSNQKIEEGLQIAKDNYIKIFDSMLIAHGVFGALANGDTKEARIYLQRLEKQLLIHRKHEIAQFYFLTAGIEFLEGNISKALESALLALKNHEEMGRPFLIEATRLNMAQILIESDDIQTAFECIERTIQYAHTMQSVLLEYQSLLIKSYGYIKQNDINRAVVSLSEGLKIGRKNDLLFLNSWWRPQIMARMFRLALEYGIEVEYVKNVVYRRNIRAEPQATETWPWAVKIYTLGHFEIFCYDKYQHFPGKSPKKPLELLKYLCACEGKVAHQDRIINALWPSHSSETGEQSLATTLHRLRKLLVFEGAIILEDRYLSLNLGYVWVDCIAFIRESKRIDTMSQLDLEYALNSYTGDFVEGEMSFWAIGFRERLRDRHIKIIQHLGKMLEGDNLWDKAAECYSKGIEIHPVSEILYRKLMVCYIQMRQHTEALVTYQRCRRSLLTHLGATPSPETQNIYLNLSQNY